MRMVYLCNFYFCFGWIVDCGGGCLEWGNCAGNGKAAMHSCRVVAFVAGIDGMRQGSGCMVG